MTELQTNSEPIRTICGPFDNQFRKKFLGRQHHSLRALGNKFIKTPSLNTIAREKVLSDANLLPKIKEIQKIAKSERKRIVKMNKYVDGVSDLQLYIAKKMMKNQSTKEILIKMEQLSANQYQNRKALNDNYLKMSTYASTDTHFYKLSNEHQSAKQLMSLTASKTSFNPEKKWVSDRQFQDKFDKFIVKKHQEEPVSMKDFLGQQQKQSEVEIFNKIQLDKQVLTKIVRNMISDHNFLTEHDNQQITKNTKSQSEEDGKNSQIKDIDWIIKECDQLQTKTFRKKIIKSLKK